ncbi:MAG: tryptophan synthase subunit alpha [Acidimicrobiia bacterium]
MRFEEILSDSRKEGRAALFPYLMCGIPDAAATVGLFEAMADAGADGFEVGIPYSDPLMDGPIIQKAGARALSAGMTLHKGLELTERVAASTGLPCAVMTYVNPILRAGLERFAADVAASGASAVIAADLPVDESDEIGEALGAVGVGLVQFAAPTTTDARLDLVVERASPFVYGIAEMGVTGERDGSTSRAAELASRVKERSDIPLVIGVGISGPDQARVAAGVADGVIVGSAIVRRVLEAESTAAACGAIAGLVADLAKAVRPS